MNAVTFLLTYAVALSWLAPAVLSNTAAPAVHPRLVVAAWLAAVGTTIAAWVGALGILIFGAAYALVTNSALTFCVETLGVTNAVHLTPSVATSLTTALLVVTATVTLHTARRVIVATVRTRRSNHQHAEAVHIIGRPTAHRGVLAIDAEQPAIYCVAGGRKRAIVVTTTALGLLNDEGLAAVLAHEEAHLRGRHHHIVGLLSGLSTALPRLPLMRNVAQTVPPLLEMCADQAATREHGRAPLVKSLVLLSTGHRIPDGALAAAGTAVLERLLYLTQPPPRSPWRAQAYLSAIAAICATPAVALVLCS